MEIDKELVRKVKEKFGLNIYETKVWLALVSKGVASSSEISSISGVPRSRTYDVLSSLEKKGFAIAKVGKPTKYIAVEPTIVLDKLKNNVMIDAEERISVLENLKDSKEYDELKSLHNSAFEMVKKEDLSSLLNGRTNIYVHFKNAIDKAKKNAIIYLPVSEITEKSRIFKEIFSKLKSKKINARFILQGDEKEIKQVEQKFGINAEQAKIPASFLMADDKVMFLLSEKIDEESKGICINSDFFSNSLAKLIIKSLN
jgi:sugar-specific transcriptional regulator TrmB